MDGDEEGGSCQRARSDPMFLLLALWFSNVSLKRRLFKKHHIYSEIEIHTKVPGGVDFSQAVRTEDGRLCVVKVFIDAYYFILVVTKKIFWLYRTQV